METYLRYFQPLSKIQIISSFKHFSRIENEKKESNRSVKLAFVFSSLIYYRPHCSYYIYCVVRIVSLQSIFYDTFICMFSVWLRSNIGFSLILINFFIIFWILHSIFMLLMFFSFTIASFYLIKIVLLSFLLQSNWKYL